MKILVIQQKMIGDVLTSTILFEALRKEYPKAELHYLIQNHTRPVVENNPFIDKLILSDPLKNNVFSGLKELSLKIREGKYDVVIDVYAKLNSAFITKFSGAGIRISYHKWYTSHAYSKTFNLKPKAETIAGLAVENRMMLLKGFPGRFPKELKPKIYLTSEEIKLAKDALIQAHIPPGKQLIMVGVMGSSPEKTYPLKYMATILDFIFKKTNAGFLFNYIPHQHEEAKKLFQLCSPATRENIYFEVTGKNLREFIALTSLCRAYIGNEGGAANMAKALEIPTFSIFSPQIKKENWALYEDGKKNISVHLEDYNPKVLGNLSKHQIRDKAAHFYELLLPNLILAKIEKFLSHNLSKINNS